MSRYFLGRRFGSTPVSASGSGSGGISGRAPIIAFGDYCGGSGLARRYGNVPLLQSGSASGSGGRAPIIAMPRGRCVDGRLIDGEVYLARRYGNVARTVSGSGVSSSRTPVVVPICNDCPTSGSASGSSSGSGQEPTYSEDCCEEEGVAADWSYTITTKGCSSNHFYHTNPYIVDGVWFYVAPMFGGLEAAYEVILGTIIIGGYVYNWDECFCTDTTTSVDVPMSVISTAQCGGGTLLDINQIGSVTIGPKLKIVRRQYQSIGGPGALPNPAVDTVVTGPETVEGEYSISSEFFCGCADLPSTSSLPVALLPPILQPTNDPIRVSAFAGILADVTYNFANGPRCFLCFKSTSKTDNAPGDPRYDPTFLPDQVEMCPA